MIYIIEKTLYQTVDAWTVENKADFITAVNNTAQFKGHNPPLIITTLDELISDNHCDNLDEFLEVYPEYELIIQLFEKTDKLYSANGGDWEIEPVTEFDACIDSLLDHCDRLYMAMNDDEAIDDYKDANLWDNIYSHKMHEALGELIKENREQNNENV